MSCFRAFLFAADSRQVEATDARGRCRLPTGIECVIISFSLSSAQVIYRALSDSNSEAIDFCFPFSLFLSLPTLSISLIPLPCKAVVIS